MSLKGEYRREGYKPTNSCSGKRRYLNRADAARAVRQHTQRVICIGYNEYWCERHQAWHVGHPNKNRKKIKVIRECVEYFAATVDKGNGRQR